MASLAPFSWLSPQKILFGDGRVAELGALAAGFGNQALLVTGGRSLRASGRLDRIFADFEGAGLNWLHLKIDHEPTTEAVDELTARAAEFHPHVVVAVGGGSVLDAAKAVAALLANGGVALDYLEGVGRGAQLNIPAAPMIAVPTTAGTGSEATKNAVIGDAARTFKKSMRSDGMLPAVALVDPELTHDCPLAVTAASGMDALTQLLESYTSTRANPISDALAREGLAQIGALGRIGRGPEQSAARSAVALGSLLGGVCLANVGLGAVHGLVSPLGAHFPVPHGAGCAAMLPAVVRVNARRLDEAGGVALATLQKYGIAHELLTDSDEEISDDALEDALALADFLAGLNATFGIPGLGHYGITAADLPRIVAGARGNSMKTNPVELTDAELTEILEASL